MLKSGFVSPSADFQLLTQISQLLIAAETR